MWERLPLQWQVCLEEAWAAYCAGCTPIGATITSPEGAILVRGRNRLNQAAGDPGHTYGHPLAHAELNALITLDYKSVDPHTCILYTLVEPCPLCLGAFYMSGLRHLYYAARDPYAGSVNLLGATPYLSRKPVRACGAEFTNLENISLGLCVEFEMHGGARSRPVLEVWQYVVPKAVRLGETLFQSGELRRLCEQKSPAGQVFDLMEEVLNG